jgi:hypothetical protein
MTAALVALAIAAVAWLLAGLFTFMFVWPRKINGQYWDIIDPISPEKAASKRWDAIMFLMVVSAIASVHLTIAILHWRTSWGRWFTMSAGAFYLVGAFCLLIVTLCHSSDAGALPMYAVGAVVLSVLMLNGARKPD